MFTGGRHFTLTLQNKPAPRECSRTHFLSAILVANQQTLIDYASQTSILKYVIIYKHLAFAR